MIQFWGGGNISPVPINLNFYKDQFCKKFKTQENFGSCSHIAAL